MFTFISIPRLLPIVLLLSVWIAVSCQEPVSVTEQPKTKLALNTESMYSVNGILAFKTNKAFRAVLDDRTIDLTKMKDRLETKYAYKSMLSGDNNENERSDVAMISPNLLLLLNSDQLIIIGLGLYKFSGKEVKMVGLAGGFSLNKAKNDLLSSSRNSANQVKTWPVKFTSLKNINNSSARVGKGYSASGSAIKPDGFPTTAHYGNDPCQYGLAIYGEFGVSSLLYGVVECSEYGGPYDEDCRCWPCTQSTYYEYSMSSIGARAWTKKHYGAWCYDQYYDAEYIQISPNITIWVDNDPPITLNQNFVGSNMSIFYANFYSDNVLRNTLDVQGSVRFFARMAIPLTSGHAQPEFTINF